MTPRRSLLLLVLFILLAAAINFPLATTMLRSRLDDDGRTIINVIGPGAASFEWPFNAPHEQAWPEPTQYSAFGAFGYRKFIVFSSNDPEASFQMECERIGWPLPVYERVRMWWPWDDPNWKTTAQPDPAMSIHWSGTLLNPIILGGGAWLLLVGPFVAFSAVRKAMRTRAGRCPRCGYNLRGAFDDGCSECGWNRAETAR